MMGNLWVKSSILFGLAVGIWFGGWIPIIWPETYAHLIIPVPFGLLSMWIGAKARGTDGWGGPWSGPTK